jgi:hypothetical protein
MLIDRSGSMEIIKRDMEGALKTMLDAERGNPDPCKLTVGYFNSRLVEGLTLPIQQHPIPEIAPSGATALLDAACQLIDRTGRRLEAMPVAERPDRVLFVIITDGEENASSIHTVEDLKRRIEHQSSVYKWQFSFLGANMDAIKVAKAFGIPANFAATYRAAPGVGAAVGAVMSNLVRSARNVQNDNDFQAAVSYSDTQRESLLDTLNKS